MRESVEDPGHAHARLQPSGPGFIMHGARDQHRANGPLVRPPPCPLAVVIVTYNSIHVLQGLLDSLISGLEGVGQFEVVIVDNNSCDGSADFALAHPLRPRLIRSRRNGGYAAGINAATATLKSDSDVLILNPDIRLQPGCVQALLGRFADPSIGIVVPRNLCADGSLDPTIRREPSVRTAWAESLLGGKVAARLGLSEIVDGGELYGREGLVEWASGSALLISSRARRAVGAWDESFFLYSEEVDYQRRARSCGFGVAYVPDAEVVHVGGECHTSPHLYALLTANRIRYFRRHHGPLSTLAFRAGIAAGEAFRFARGATHRAAFLSVIFPNWHSRHIISSLSS